MWRCYAGGFSYLTILVVWQPFTKNTAILDSNPFASAFGKEGSSFEPDNASESSDASSDR